MPSRIKSRRVQVNSPREFTCYIVRRDNKYHYNTATILTQQNIYKPKLYDKIKNYEKV